MSDILIRGMEMPHNCDECKLCAFIPIGEYDLYRKCMPLNRNAEFTVRRRKDCPLVELPEHVDLIDKEKLYDLVKQRGRNWAGEWCDSECHITGNDIKNSPVIVPANKEKTE